MILVVDFENYSGNFERELCAFLTGQVGECGVGQEITMHSQKAIKNIDWWNQHIVQKEDDDGCLMPVQIWETPGWFNNGLGKHFRDTPENEQIALKEAIEYMTEYVSKRMSQAKRRLSENDFEEDPNGYTQKNCDAVIEHCENEIKRVSVLTKYPAYQSIAIFVDEEPSDEVWSEFQERTRFFANNQNDFLRFGSDDSLIITGFRKIINNN